MNDAELAAYIEIREGFLAQAERSPRENIFERTLIANDAVEQALTAPPIYRRHTLTDELVKLALDRCAEVRGLIRALRVASSYQKAA